MQTVKLSLIRGALGGLVVTVMNSKINNGAIC